MEKCKSKHTEKYYFMLIWLLLFPSSVIAGVFLFSPPLEEKIKSYSEEKGMCTILKQEYEINVADENGTDYLIEMTYEVVTHDGYHTQVSGYNGPRVEAVSSEETAQNILKRYPIGSTHPCWYRKGKPAEAVLVVNMAENAAIAWLLGIGGGLCLACAASWFFASLKGNLLLSAFVSKTCEFTIFDNFLLLFSMFLPLLGSSSICLLITAISWWVSF